MSINGSWLNRSRPLWIGRCRSDLMLQRLTKTLDVYVYHLSAQVSSYTSHPAQGLQPKGLCPLPWPHQSGKSGCSPLRLPANSISLRSAPARLFLACRRRAMPRKSASPPPPSEAAASSGATTSGKRPAEQPPDLTPAQKALRSKPARPSEDSDKKVVTPLFLKFCNFLSISLKSAHVQGLFL